jgi:hypothetical protein
MFVRRAQQLLLLVSLPLAANGCGGDDDSAATFGTALRFECSEATDNWSQCNDGKVEWCHAVGTPHFHFSSNCEAAGLECFEVSEDEALCVDPTRACDDTTPSVCEERTAVRCVENLTVVEPCGTAKECVILDGVARCEVPAGRPEPVLEEPE